MKIKVLFFISGLTSGGIAKGLIPLVNSLSSDPDIDIDLLIGSGANNVINDNEILPKTFYLNRAKGFKNMSNLSRLKALKRLFSVFLDGEYDIVVSCGAYARWLGPVMATLFRIRSIALEHVAFSPEHHIEGKLARKFFLLASKLRFSLSDIISPISDSIGKEIIDLCGVKSRKIKKLFNWYDFNNIRLLSEEKVITTVLPLSCRNKLISVCRLVERKGLMDLIHAVKRLRDKGYDCGIIIVGDGPIRGKLEAEINNLGLTEYVKLTGYIKNPYWFMKKSDIFILNSDFEGTPTVIVEAMALGLPVIATDCPSGVREMLDTEFGLAGRLVPVNDSQALDNSIVELMSFPQITQDFSVITSKVLVQYANENVRNDWMDLLLNRAS